MKSFRAGFSIVEILVTLAIMAILLLIGFSSYQHQKYQAEARQKISDARTIGKLIDGMYDTAKFRNLSLGEKGRFPNIAQMNTQGWATQMMKEYDSTSNLTFVMATSNSATLPIANYTNNSVKAARLNNLVYQPLTIGGALCSGTAPNNICSSYRLHYIYIEPSAYDAVLNRKTYKQGYITNHDIQQ